MLFFSISLIFFALMDLYVYQSVKAATSKRWTRRLYWAISIAAYIYMIATVLTFDSANESRKVLNGFMSIIMLWYVPKFVVLAFLIPEDLIRLPIGLYRRLFQKERKDLGERFVPGRRRFIHNVALGLAAVPLAGVVHGIWKGRYNFRVIKKTLFFEDLPDAFDGFTITQVSDIHSGSFDNREKIQYGIDLIKAQNTDLFLFTGDMVNNRSDEVVAWVDVLKEIRAPYGQFAVLGNHDYGTYRTWSEDEKEQERLAAVDTDRLVEIQQNEIGFRNLRNESVKIEKDGQTFDLVGVENWGQGFHQEGDLDKATEGLDDDSFKILMSHDPTHFDVHVKNYPKKINLTLSGHTHGMQFGIEIPGFIKWSPASFRYPKWAGLYEENGRYLYVNRGFGYLAYPGRTGIWPEVTVFELRKKSV
ncbi:MAG: metallophosphoesterase [Flavobacteriia bacterium]|nr:metallophosphoesterase [Flavobacteriia bacterium]